MDTALALWNQLITTLQAWNGSVGETVAPVTGQAINGLDMTSLLALAAALGWASGFRLYAVVFLTGLLGQLGWLPLPSGLQVLMHPAMLAASGALLFVEFFADKIPGLDSLWDLLNSVIRVPAGAALAAAALGADSGTMALVGALLGGGLAMTAQAAKTSTRAAINASPEPFSNVLMSLFEDGLVVAILWLASNHPLLFAGVAVVAVLLMWAITWMLFKFLRVVFLRARAVFSVPA
jgi:Domain of unknown function (DUF4126)